MASTPAFASAAARAASIRAPRRRGMRPSGRVRSVTSRRRCRGTSGSGFAMARSYSSYLRSRPISSVSAKPAVVMSPVTAPFRSISALVKSVVAWTVRETAAGSTRAWVSRPAAPAATARAGSSWVVRTLRLQRLPASWSWIPGSVKVPPMSMPREYWAIRRIPSPGLELEILRGRRVREPGDEAGSALGHPRPDAPDEGQLVDRHGDCFLEQELLDLAEQRLALLRVQLASLARVEIVDLRETPVGVDAVPGDVRLEPGGRVAEGGGDDQDHPVELL